ncbi:MAG: hypothetical protein V1743_08300 [Nanoarchaeota archaeon]
MDIPYSRKKEIDAVIEDILTPYEHWLASFTFEQLRERFHIWKILVTNIWDATPGLTFGVRGSYVIVLKNGEENKEKTLGHELGHLALSHLEKRVEERVQYFSSLSRYQKWERYVVNKEEPPFPFGDNPMEYAEAEYFSECFTKKLRGVDWLRGLKVENLDNIL